MQIARVPLGRILAALAVSAGIGPLAVALLGMIEDGFDLFSGAVYFLTTMVFTLPAMGVVVVPAALALHSRGKLNTWKPAVLAATLGGAVAAIWFHPNYNWPAVGTAVIVGLLCGSVVRPMLLRSNNALQATREDARA